jgi:hydroxypyruvate isomerase
MSATKYLVPKLERRQFVGGCAAAAFGAAAGVPLQFIPRGPLLAPSGTASPLLSVMLWTVEPKLPFEQRVAKVAEAGYHAIELVNEYERWQPSDFAQTRKQLQKLSIVVDACSGIDASLCDPAQRDLLLRQLRATLPMLSELECSRLILLTGNKVVNLSHEQMRSNTMEALKQAAEICERQKVEILLENIDPEENPKYFLTSVAEGFEIVREVNHPRVRFLYDFFHEQIAEGNLIEKLEKNLDLIGLVHVADVPGRHAPGTGEINYTSIYRKLGQLGYSKYIAMEFLATSDVVTELRKARESVQKYFAEGHDMAVSETQRK